MRAFAKKKKIEKLEKVNFRDKISGWKNYSLKIEGYKGHEKIIFLQDHSENKYMKGFVSDLYTRPSCFNCPSKSISSGADVTIGDFWGIFAVKPDIDDDKGISALLINTEKGSNLVDSVNIHMVDVEYSDIIKGNPCIINSTRRTAKRDAFYSLYKKKGIIFSIKKLTKLPLKDKIKLKISLIIQKLRTK